MLSHCWYVPGLAEILFLIVIKDDPAILFSGPDIPHMAGGSFLPSALFIIVKGLHGQNFG